MDALDDDRLTLVGLLSRARRLAAQLDASSSATPLRFVF